MSADDSFQAAPTTQPTVKPTHSNPSVTGDQLKKPNESPLSNATDSGPPYSRQISNALLSAVSSQSSNESEPPSFSKEYAALHESNVVSAHAVDPNVTKAPTTTGTGIAQPIGILNGTSNNGSIATKPSESPLVDTPESKSVTPAIDSNHTVNSPAASTASPDTSIPPTNPHSEASVTATKNSSPAETNGKTVCQNCETTTTPLWRRDENGQVLCNACGLFLKLHGRKRPISLKTDVIKSRNRSRNPPVSVKRLKSSQHNQIHIPHQSGSPSFPALSPRIASHGSPMKTPLSTPQTAAHYGDLNNIDHIHLSATNGHGNGLPGGVIENGHDMRHQPNAGHRQQHRVVSTPSSVFSYPSSPVLSAEQHNLHSHMNKSLPSLSGATGSAYGNGSPNILPPPNRLFSSAHNSPSFGPNQSATTVPSFASLSAIASHVQNPSGPGSANGKSSANGKVMTPHILTPQSRPHSPQSGATNGPSLGPSAIVNAAANRAAYHQAPSHILSAINSPQVAPTTSALRMSGAMSEQLRPKSPDSLDRIPPLKHISALDRQSGYSGRGSSGGSPVNGSTGHDGDYEMQALKTRISELEIVNDLYRSKVSQLEYSEGAARRAESTIRESELMLRKQVEDLMREVSQLKRMADSNASTAEGHESKRIKVSELI